jgi:uncharacterized protein YggE
MTTLMLTGTAPAQASGDVDPFSIRVTGDATVVATPDQADIDVAVITRGDTAKRAAAANAHETRRVLVEIERLIGSAGTTRTIGYSVHPEHRYPREGREPQVSGYVAANVVRVSVSQLEQVGELIDLAIGTGANRVQRVNFTLKDEQPVYAQALHQAATRARSEADALAAALGLRIQRVLSAVEEPTAVQPLMETFRTANLAAESATTPVEPGTIEVEARVLVTFEVSSAP